ncbi:MULTISPECIES: PQQ-binding-like beta-propeller repeat protein [unclassified Streptomyces]|uniref:outer membrane protein assembly factor BamB family protein n=1 Tax=unclassified Streptomyces TaxID=2593676 RepID=UPI00338F5C09
MRFPSWARRARRGWRSPSSPPSTDCLRRRPAVADGPVFLPGEKLTAIDADTGATVWTLPPSGRRGFHDPTVIDGVLYATDLDRGIRAANAGNGNRIRLCEDGNRLTREGSCGPGRRCSTAPPVTWAAASSRWWPGPAGCVRCTWTDSTDATGPLPGRPVGQPAAGDGRAGGPRPAGRPTLSSAADAVVRRRSRDALWRGGRARKQPLPLVSVS